LRQSSADVGGSTLGAGSGFSSGKGAFAARVVKDGATDGGGSSGNLAGFGSGDEARVGFILGFVDGSTDIIDGKELTIFLVATLLIPDAFKNGTDVTLFTSVDDSVSAIRQIDRPSGCNRYSR